MRMLVPAAARLPLVAAALALAAIPCVAGGQSDQIQSPTGDITVHPIEHASLVLTWSGRTVHVDPVGGAGLYEAFARPDLVLITHTHGDHLDAQTLAAVAGQETRIVAPQAVVDKLGAAERTKTTVLANGETTDQIGITIEAVPMYNLTEERQRFHAKGQGNGYVVTLGEKRVYIAGDTEDIPEMRALKQIDAAFLCMNLPYTMTVEQAADATLEFKPKIVYPYHYRGTEGMADVGRFKELVSKDPGIEVRLLEWYTP